MMHADHSENSVSKLLDWGSLTNVNINVLFIVEVHPDRKKAMFINYLMFLRSCYKFPRFYSLEMVVEKIKICHATRKVLT